MRTLIPARLLILALAGFSLEGCGVISSLEFDDRLLVKLPGKSEIQQCRAQGWEFRHVAEGPDIPGEPIGEWYITWNMRETASAEGRPHLSFPWSRWVYARHHTVDIVGASQAAFGAYPIMIEPDFVFSRSVARGEDFTPKPAAPTGSPPGGAQDLIIRNRPLASWPNPTDKNGNYIFNWHLGPDYTQLADAAHDVDQNHGANRIRIGILDDGFSAAQAAFPERLIDSREGDAMNILLVHGQPVAPGSTGATHGTGAIGILSGRRVKLGNSDSKNRPLTVVQCGDYLGGAPRAIVVPVRIAPWVFSVTTANLAYGIDYASRHRKCDVISMSHGGAPCEVWADAVNAAYERGTAMFAATGDFFSTLPEPIQPRGIIVPSGPVYPAAFRRVMGVTGVTSEGTSYAENSLGRLIAHPFSFDTWIARGSYGPDGSWRTPFGMNETPDGPTVKYQGKLRAYPIAAYSPNIPWLVAPTKDDPRTNLVDMDGAGTSAATPQVAAAAALWLDQHQPEFGDKWNTWVKTEAVYTALLLSAQRPTDTPWPDRYLGAGKLRALDALKINLNEIEALGQNPKRFGDGTIALRFAHAPRDFYDGSRSFLSLFGLVDDPVLYNEEADLDQRSQPGISREDAFRRIFYNTLLLQEWHSGHLPKGEIITHYFRRNQDLQEEADSLTRHYSATSSR